MGSALPFADLCVPSVAGLSPCAIRRVCSSCERSCAFAGEIGGTWRVWGHLLQGVLHCNYYRVGAAAPG